MILNTHKPVIETSEDFESTLFSIGDFSVIFDILRNKMYSNPIMAICREIGVNALDSHREVGKENVPIQITLPTTLEPFYRIKDWGPGLNKDRIANVYTKYGSSTKRGDNTQIGFFGCGAKTPWSYGPDFSIETIVDGTKYCYQCFIDSKNIGSIALLNSEPTDQGNGTEISIPIKPADFNAFRDGTFFVTKHWTVPPIIKGTSSLPEKLIFTLSGEGWAIAEDKISYGREIKLIIDGIEYPLDLTQIKDAHTLTNAINGNTYLYFKTGELSLAANRESVHLDQATRVKIEQRLSSIIKDILAKAQEKLDACPDLFAAHNCMLNDLSPQLSGASFIKAMKWQGIEVGVGSYMWVDPTKVHLVEASRKSCKQGETFYSNETGYLYFTEYGRIYLNDLDLSSKDVDPYIRGLFKEEPGIKQVYLVSPVKSSSWKKINDDYHFDKMNPGKISDITPIAVSALNAKATKATASKPRLLTFRFNSVGKKFEQISYAAATEDTGKKILCSLVRDPYYPRTARLAQIDTNNISVDILSYILEKNKNFSIYGVDQGVPEKRIEEEFKGFTSLQKFLDSKMLDSDKIDYAEIKYAKKQEGGDYSTVYFLREHGKRIENKDSPLFKIIEVKNHFRDLVEKKGDLLRIYELLKGVVSEAEVKKWESANPDKNIPAMEKEIFKTYPLLNHISYYQGETMTEAVLAYINLIDAQIKTKEN